MISKVGIEVGMWLSKWAWWLVYGCQSGHGGWYMVVKVGNVVVKVGIMAKRWLLKWVLWLVSGSQCECCV